MFLKLLKHDFKYYTRNFMLIVVGVLCFTILASLQNRFLDDGSFYRDPFRANLKEAILILVAIILIYSIMLGIKIFNRKFISRESYLTFSLPVTKNQQLLSNLIVCLIWCAIVSIIYYVFLLVFFDYSCFLKAPLELLKGIKYHCSRVLGVNFSIAVVDFVMTLNIIYFCVAFVNSTNIKRFSKLIGLCLFSVIVYVYMNIVNLISQLCYNDVYMNNVYLIAAALVANIIFYFSTLHILENKIEVD